MPSYSASIDIAAPREAVWAQVADLTRHPAWSADPVEISPAGDGRFRSSVRAKGKAIEAALTVVEERVPERFVFEAADLTGRWRHTFTLAASPAGTTLTREIAGDLSGKQLLLYWLVLLPIKKPAAARALARLKELVEREAPEARET